MTFRLPSRHIPPLPHLLADLLSPAPSLTGVRDAADLCYRIAYAYLVARSRNTSLLCRAGSSMDDLTFDAVVSVFGHDESGHGFPHLAKAIPGGTPSPDWGAHLLPALQSAVSAYLEEELVRRIFNAYPPIERILRNLRNAVTATRTLTDIRQGDEHWVTVNGPDDLQRPLPDFPLMLLERMLLADAARHSTVPSLVPALVKALGDQTTYKPAVRLTSLAVAVQNVYLLAGRRDLAGLGCPGERADRGFERNVLRSMAEVETRLRHQLVQKEGVPATVYAAYFHAATEILKRSMCFDPDITLSFYEVLCEHLGDVGRRSYFEEHRPRLEFIVNSARRRYLERVKNP